jgi:hypothetical protein
MFFLVVAVFGSNPFQEGDEIFPAAQSQAAFAAPQSLLNRLVAVLYALGSMHDCVLTAIMAEVRRTEVDIDEFGSNASRYIRAFCLVTTFRITNSPKCVILSCILAAGTIAYQTRVAAFIVCRSWHSARTPQADSTRPRDLSGARYVVQNRNSNFSKPHHWIANNIMMDRPMRLIH